MNIYHLTRTDRICWDEAYGVVLIATCPLEARKRAASIAYDEGPDIWLSSETHCYFLAKTELTQAPAATRKDAPWLISQAIQNG